MMKGSFKLHLYRIPSFNSLMLGMNVSVNGKKIKLISNQTIEIPISSENIELKAGKMIWTQTLNLVRNGDIDLYVVLGFRSTPANLLMHFVKPLEYIQIKEVDEVEFRKRIEDYSDLSFVKQSAVNFIDAATVFIGVLFGAMYLAINKGAFSVEFFYLAVISIAILLSVVVRRIAKSTISQQGMLFRNVLVCTFALLWYLQNFQIAGLVIFGIAIFGFGAMWKISKNSFLIQ